MKKDKPSIASFLGYTSLIAAAGAAIYNVSFFMVIDLKLIGFLSLDDHLMAFICIFPFILISTTLGTYFDPPWIPEDEDLNNLKRVPGWENMPRWRRRLPTLSITIIVFLAVWSFAPEDSYFWYCLIAIPIWVMIFHEFLERSEIKDVFSPKYKWTNHIACIALIISFSGMESGANALKQDKQTQIEISLVSSEKITGNLVRSGENGVLISIPEKQEIGFIPRDKINYINLEYRQHPWNDFRLNNLIKRYITEHG